MVTLTPILAELLPNSNVTSSIYSTNVGKVQYGSMMCVNHGPNIDQVSVAMVPNANILTSNSWICFESNVHVGHSVALQGLFFSTNDSLMVRSKAGTTNFVFTGTLLT